METLIIHSDNHKITAIKAFLKAFEVKFESKTIDTTDFLLHNPKNKKRLLEAIERSKENNFESHSLIEA